MARVQVLSTPGCAGCDALKRTLTKVLAEFAGLDWEEIDLIEHPEVAERYQILSVPAVVSPLACGSANASPGRSA